MIMMISYKKKFANIITLCPENRGKGVDPIVPAAAALYLNTILGRIFFILTLTVHMVT